MTESVSAWAVEAMYRTLGLVPGIQVWKHFQQLQAQQWLSPDELSAIRWAKLQSLLAYAATEIPFYRDLWGAAGVDPRRFSHIDDLRHLPVVTRGTIITAQAADGFLLSRRRDYQMTHSSGTTGPRVYLPFTRQDMQVKYAGYLREFYATDWRLGIPSAALHYSGHPEFGGRYVGAPDRDNYVVTRTLAFRLAHRRILLPPYADPRSGSETVVAGWYKALRSHRPFLLESMDFNLVALHHYIQDHNLPRLRIPRTIVLATLASRLKEALEEAFSTEIFDRYGPHEMEGVAYACHEHRGMHMAIDSVHTEFLDRSNRPVGPGEHGRIVLTDLDSRLMPLIRYEIGDVGSYLAEPCSCGRGFPLMNEIAGRTRDQFATVTGEPFLPAPLVAALQEEPSIRLFQLVQAAPGEIDVRVVPAPDAWTADSVARITSRLVAMLPPDAARIRVTRVGGVELEANGKFCYAKRQSPVNAAPEVLRHAPSDEPTVAE